VKESIDPERCTWVLSPKTGRAYSLCGVDAAGETIDELELCPRCGKLVEHATWDELEET